MSGCYYDIESNLYPNGQICDSLAISYSLNVAPIISSRCLGCHSITANQGNIKLETYTQVKTKVDDGKLGCSINHQAGCSSMPKNAGQLPPCELKAINVWISEGALDN
jgi:uncharacterized membrane protein